MNMDTPEVLFYEKNNPPTEDMISKALDARYELWTNLHHWLSDRYGPINQEWKMYSVKYGWTMKSLRKKRNLFFCSVYRDFFQVTFVFGDKAVAEAERSELPETLKSRLREARRYAEGRGLSVDAETDSDLDNIKELVRIKTAF